MHNLNEYNEIHAADVMTNAGDSLNAVFTERLGVVINESQLEEFFKQIPWYCWISYQLDLIKSCIFIFIL